MGDNRGSPNKFSLAKVNRVENSATMTDARMRVVKAYLSIVWVALWVTNAIADSSEREYAIAAQYYADENWDLAATAFGDFTQQHSDSPQAVEAAFYAGESLVQLNRYDDAAEYFQQFLEAAPEHESRAQAFFRSGECAYLANRPVAALRQLREFNRLYPEHELQQYALPYLGSLSQTASDQEGAIQAFSKALSKYPRGPYADECLLGLATLAYEQQRYTDAAEFLSQLKRKFPESDLQAEAAYWLGLVNFDEQKYGEAAKNFAEVKRRRPEHRRIHAIEYLAAESLRRVGQLDAAIPQLQEITQQLRDNEWADDALVSLMRIALKQNDHQGVANYAASIEQSVPQSNRRMEAEHILGESLIKQQLFRQAVEIFSELVKQENLNEQARSTSHYLLGVAFLGLDNPAETLSQLKKVNVDGQGINLRTQVELAKAMAFNALGQHENAAKLLLNANGDLGEQGQAQLIFALIKSEDLQTATEVLSEWQQQPDANANLLTTARRHLADANFSQSNYQDASQLYAKILAGATAAPLLNRGLSGLGWCHFRMGNDRAALKAFDELIEKAPDSTEAREARLPRARSLERLDEKDKALEAYLEIAQMSEKNEQWATAMLASIDLLKSKDRIELAIDFLQELKDHPQLHGRMDLVLYKLGWLESLAGNPQKSFAAYKTLYLEQPESEYWTDATYRMADIAYQEDRIRTAERLLKKLNQVHQGRPNPKLIPFVKYLEGRISAHRADWTNTISILRPITEKNPESPVATSAHFWLAEAHFQLKEYDEAIPHLVAVGKAQDREAEPWQAIVLLRLAQIKAIQRSWEEVDQILSRLQDRFRDFERSYEIRYLEGQRLVAAAHFDESRTSFQEAIDDPRGQFTETAAKAQWMIGETYLHQNAAEQALRAYLKVDMLYDYPEWRAAALLQAGKCYERLGKIPNARELYERITTEIPATEYHETAQQRLLQIKAGTPAPPKNRIRNRISGETPLSPANTSDQDGETR